MTEFVMKYSDLRLYQNAIDSAMEIFQITKDFPAEEKYSMVDQMRRSSRSVCANIAEGWRKRRYKAAFIAKLSDAESEAAETQVWLELAEKCGYLDLIRRDELLDRYDHISAQIVLIIEDVDKWLIKKSD